MFLDLSGLDKAAMTERTDLWDLLLFNNTYVLINILPIESHHQRQNIMYSLLRNHAKKDR